jgi:hypothetical protein
MRAAIDTWPGFTRGAFTLKPRLGTSGRGRIDGRIERRGDPDVDALSRRLPKLAAAGGAVLEPWLDRTRDLSAQLCVTEDGTVILLGTLEQHVTRHGRVLGHCGEIDSRGRIFSGLPDDEALREAAASIAAAAGRQGYAGPCGVDAFVFRWPEDRGSADEREREILRSVVELNARFTLGTVAVGLARRHLQDARDRLGLRSGERRAFALYLDAPRNDWTAACDAAGPGAFVVALHGQGDPVHPGLLFARSRTDLERALGDGAGIASSNRDEGPT